MGISYSLVSISTINLDINDNNYNQRKLLNKLISRHKVLYYKHTHTN